MKRFYINVQGGLGMNIALASYLSWVKENAGKDEYFFAVISPYFDVFECCPAVDRVYKASADYRDFVFDARAEDAVIINHRLYDMDQFIKKQVSYPAAWQALLGLSGYKDNGKGAITKSILDTSRLGLGGVLDGLKKELTSKGYEDYIMVQFCGGQSPLRNDMPLDKDGRPDWSKAPYEYSNEPLKRHYPVDKARIFINNFAARHPKTAVVLYQLPNEPRYDNTLSLMAPYLAYYDIANDPMCRGIVAIDSSLQHLAAGLKKMVVLWGHSLPDSFGYDNDKTLNIVQKCRRDDILYFTQLGPSGAAIDYIDPVELEEKVTEWLYDSEDTKEEKNGSAN